MKQEVWQQDWLARWALYRPEKAALQEHEEGRMIQYRDLNALANGMASYLLTQHGVKKGDRVVVIAEYSITLVALFGAAQKLGFAMVPLNYRLAAPEIKEISEDAGPVLIFYENHFAHLLPQSENIPAYEMQVLEAVQPQPHFDVKEVEEDDSLFIIYTSGTTGKPKGVRYTHKMAFWNSINTALSLSLSSENRTVNVMPPFHTGGWNVLLLPFLHHGGFTYLFKKFEADQVLARLAEMKCNIFMGVPTMLSMMAQDPNFESTDLSHLDYIIVGGESMPVPLIEKYASKGIAIRQGYGMTEVGPNLTSLHQDDAIRKKGSIGRPNFYVQHRIVKEDGKEALANEAGELWLRGPMVTPGYWNNAEAGKAAFSEDGLWFKTGDIVIEDEERYLYIVDRLKNMYISGAENVYPAEIERVLKQNENITDCAVIGVKDEKWGEVGKAFVVLKQPVDEASLKAFCTERLAKFKVPKYFIVLEALPLTDSGKIDRKKLKQQ